MSVLTPLYKLWNDMVNSTIFILKRVQASPTVKINGVVMIVGCGRNISIGSGTTISSGKRANPIGGASRTILSVSPNGKIKIGKDCGISNSAIVASTSVIIEDQVMIGGNCKIYDTDFHSIDFDSRMMKPDPTIKCREVRIKKGAFIGAHSIILKGVCIGEKSVIGAGSVVTRDVPDGEVWGGNPAQFIKVINK